MAYIYSEYERLTQTTPTTPTTSSSEFNVGDIIMFDENIPGYRSSGALISSTTVEAGTYTVYQTDDDSRHPVNISCNGNIPGVWVDTTKLYKQPSQFAVGDSVYVSEATIGYDSSTGSESTTTIDPGYYIVYQTADGAKYPVNISNDGNTPGSWVNSASLKLQSLYQEGETVTLTKTTPGYKTSTATKPASFVPKGTYYVYKYVEDDPHPLNISSKAEEDGAWVDLTNITR